MSRKILVLVWLVFLGAVWGLASGVVYAQGTDTPTPSICTDCHTPIPYSSPTASPTASPTMDFSCPGSLSPEGYGVVTPSAFWLLNCGHCLPTGTAEPSVTPRPSATVSGPDLQLTANSWLTASPTASQVVPTATLEVLPTIAATPIPPLGNFRVWVDNSGASPFDQSSVSCVFHGADGHTTTINLLSGVQREVVYPAYGECHITAVSHGGWWGWEAITIYFRDLPQGWTASGIVHNWQFSQGYYDVPVFGTRDEQNASFTVQVDGANQDPRTVTLDLAFEILASAQPEPSPTPSPTPGPASYGGYCSGINQHSYDDFGFDLFQDDGPPNCDMGWVSRDFGTGEDTYHLPGVRICLQPSRFGVIRLFGENYEMGTIAIVMAVALAYRFIRTM